MVWRTLSSTPRGANLAGIAIVLGLSVACSPTVTVVGNGGSGGAQATTASGPCNGIPQVGDPCCHAGDTYAAAGTSGCFPEMKCVSGAWQQQAPVCFTTVGSGTFVPCPPHPDDNAILGLVGQPCDGGSSSGTSGPTCDSTQNCGACSVTCFNTGDTWHAAKAQVCEPVPNCATSSSSG